MGAQTNMLHVRVDEKVKVEATEALEAMGLSVSDAVRILLHRIVADQAFPLELKVPNARLRAAMAEADELAASGTARFGSADELISSLEKEGGR